MTVVASARWVPFCRSTGTCACAHVCSLHLQRCRARLPVTPLARTYALMCDLCICNHQGSLLAICVLYGQCRLFYQLCGTFLLLPSHTRGLHVPSLHRGGAGQHIGPVSASATLKGSLLALCVMCIHTVTVSLSAVRRRTVGALTHVYSVHMCACACTLYTRMRLFAFLASTYLRSDHHVVPSRCSADTHSFAQLPSLH